MQTCDGHKELVKQMAKLTTAVAVLTSKFTQYIEDQKEHYDAKKKGDDTRDAAIEKNRIFNIKLAAFVAGISFIVSGGVAFVGVAVTMKWIVI